MFICNINFHEIEYIYNKYITNLIKIIKIFKIIILYYLSFKKSTVSISIVCKISQSTTHAYV